MAPFSFGLVAGGRGDQFSRYNRDLQKKNLKNRQKSA
jgi:hypothetical protein